MTGGYANSSSDADLSCEAILAAPHGGHECSGCSAQWCVWLGIIVHVLGSVGINLGQNIQALALSKNPELINTPHKSTLWRWGITLFAVSSVITFAALALASASILVPLESIQFIVNLAFNKFVRGKMITRGMYIGVALICAGIALFVIFGPNEGECFSRRQLECFWWAPAWWVYLVISFGIAAAAYVTWRRYGAATKTAKPLPHARCC